MQVHIVSGIYTDNGPDVRTAYPVNMVPVPKASGVSNEYLRPGYGLVTLATGPGVDRGGINWNGQHYRVMGSKLVRISAAGVVTTLGDVGGGTTLPPVSMTYSFDRLAVASDGVLYYWDGSTLTQVTDVDLGTCLDIDWIDGYFASTDGENIVVTELNNPTSIDPLKYGSSEVDPDPVVAVRRLRNELVAINRYTIESFDNVGGTGFPFQRIDGAQITKGAIGTHAVCIHMDAFAFVGGGRNEPLGVYLGRNATAQKISTQEIDKLIADHDEADLASIKLLESVSIHSHRFLMLHLPDRTMVFDSAASEALSAPVWFALTSTLVGHEKYKARNFVYVHDVWHCSNPDSSAVGTISETISDHWGNPVRWEFDCPLLYNEGRGAIINSLELVALPGRVALGIDPTITTSYSIDGVYWSQQKTVNIGTTGNRNKRIAWFKQGHMRNYRTQRFMGDSDAHLSIMRLEADVAPLAR